MDNLLCSSPHYMYPLSHPVLLPEASFGVEGAGPLGPSVCQDPPAGAGNWWIIWH